MDGVTKAVGEMLSLVVGIPNILLLEEEDDEEKKLKDEEQDEGCGDAAAELSPLPPSW